MPCGWRLTDIFSQLTLSLGDPSGSSVAGSKQVRWTPSETPSVPRRISGPKDRMSVTHRAIDGWFFNRLPQGGIAGGYSWAREP